MTGRRIASRCAVFLRVEHFASGCKQANPVIQWRGGSCPPVIALHRCRSSRARARRCCRRPRKLGIGTRARFAVQPRSSSAHARRRGAGWRNSRHHGGRARPTGAGARRRRSRAVPVTRGCPQGFSTRPRDRDRRWRGRCDHRRRHACALRAGRHRSVCDRRNWRRASQRALR